MVPQERISRRTCELIEMLIAVPKSSQIKTEFDWVPWTRFFDIFADAGRAGH